MKALILVDHGSKVDEANTVVEKLAELIRSDTDSKFDIIEHCHMELAPPTIRDAFNKCVNLGATTIVIHPYFLVPGRHSKSDIPSMVEEASREYPHVRHIVTEPLGIHEKIIDVILEKSHSSLSKVKN